MKDKLTHKDYILTLIPLNIYVGGSRDGRGKQGVVKSSFFMLLIGPEVLFP